MKSTIEIIADIDANKDIDIDEAKMALLVMAKMNELLIMSLRVTGGRKADLLINALDIAKKKDPVQWLGLRNIPGTPENKALKDPNPATPKQITDLLDNFVKAHQKDKPNDDIKS
jgi:hypothetical protein